MALGDEPGALAEPRVERIDNAGKLELRVKGPQVFAGYRDAPELTAAAFDDDGFYRIGDAGRLIDESRPEAGIAFDGRVAEDFKLSSGTWVSVGTLRLAVVSALSRPPDGASLCSLPPGGASAGLVR